MPQLYELSHFKIAKGASHGNMFITVILHTYIIHIHIWIRSVPYNYVYEKNTKNLFIFYNQRYRIIILQIYHCSLYAFLDASAVEENIVWRDPSHLFPDMIYVSLLPIHLYFIFEKSSLKNQVRRTVFLTCKNQFRNWFLQATQAVKIQFVELDFSNLIFQKSSTHW